MTILEHHHTHSGGRLALRAWIAMALVPAGLALAILVSFGGENEGAGGGADGIVAALLTAPLALAAPTTAVIFAMQAARASCPSGRIALLLSSVLLLATLALLPLVIINIGAGWIIAVALVVAVLSVAESHTRNKPSPPA